MKTPHIEAELGEISKTVLMPGDPLRAKYIAEHFLENVKQVNRVRNILAYTGTFHGNEITVFASGMGNPSIGIYAYELFQFYGVEEIIRIGSCGSYVKDLNVKDLVLVANSVSDSNFAKSFCNDHRQVIPSNTELDARLLESANRLHHHLSIANIFSSDAFYHVDCEESPLIKEYGCVGVEMETFALFTIAEKLGKKASCLLTVSDSFVTKQELTSEEREKNMLDMIEIALSINDK